MLKIDRYKHYGRKSRLFVVLQNLDKTVASLGLSVLLDWLIDWLIGV